MQPFPWNEQRETAALQLAIGGLNNPAIAAAAGVSDRQLRRWKAHPDFAARVQQHIDERREALQTMYRAELRARYGVASSEPLCASCPLHMSEKVR
jgi:hypothetical protein